MADALHEPRTPRTSRSAEQRTNTPVHEDELYFGDTGPLPTIPRRSGYDHRWVRAGTETNPDPKNLMRARQRGWRPRDPSTLSESYRIMAVKRLGLGEVIATHDMVLMERPEEITRKARSITREATRTLEKAVANNLFREVEPMYRAEDGFHPRRAELRSRVERGQIRIADDDN